MEDTSIEVDVTQEAFHVMERRQSVKKTKKKEVL